MQTGDPADRAMVGQLGRGEGNVVIGHSRGRPFNVTNTPAAGSCNAAGGSPAHSRGTSAEDEPPALHAALHGPVVDVSA